MKTIIFFLLTVCFCPVIFSQQTYYFERVTEPNEKAFTILKPRGWVHEGGIYRIDPSAQGGSGQSIAAKLDFTIKNNQQGDVLIRWLPDMLYFDMRYSPAGQMGMFPQGSNYNGMQVYNLMDPFTFMQYIVIPYILPHAQNVQFVNKKNMPKVAQAFDMHTKNIMPMLTMSYQAGLGHISYIENGMAYEAKIFVLIENWGQMGAGLWGNKETFYVKAPKGKLNDYQKTYQIVKNSVDINMKWLSGEINNQRIRAGMARMTQEEMNRIDSEIGKHQRKTNAEINNDMHLTLMGQEEYVNPYTNEIEIGTNEYNHRWENADGDVIYTDMPGYDPRNDPNLKRNDFKKSKIRPR